MKKWSIVLAFLLIIGLVPISSIHSKESEVKFVFKVGSSEVMIVKEKIELKRKFTNPVIIKEDRSLLDLEFFTLEDVIDYLFKHHAKYTMDDGEAIMIVEKQSGVSLIIVIDSGRTILLNKENKEKELKAFPTPVRKKCGNSECILLPLRFIFETFGYTVEWNNKTREITVYKGKSGDITNESDVIGYLATPMFDTPCQTMAWSGCSYWTAIDEMRKRGCSEEE